MWNLYKNGVIILFQYARFEALLKSRGITKTFIGHSLGRSATLCQDWKQQKSQPSEQQLIQVARILGTTPAYLRGETDEISPDAMTEEMEQLLTSLRVEGVTLPNDDGSFDIYINAQIGRAHV